MDDELKDGNTNSNPSEDENKSNISADLIRGHINTIILRTLYERDKYGYEIIEEIDAKSHGQYSLKQPTLYSALKRLESQGYINAYWKTDEVSQGGRRKYYTLTDSGREITERNQAEWEYSRTVIDNLISDRNFDFTQPPPTAVDFKILKNSTSRVPVLKDDEDENTEGEQPVVREVKYEEPAPQIADVVREVVKEVMQDVQPTAAAPTPATVEPAPAVVEPAPAAPQIKEESQPVQSMAEPQMSEEQRRIVHENYLKLISEPVAEPQQEPAPTPYAESIDTEKLIYNNKPETERDYRNLVNSLFVKTIKPQAEQPAAPAPVKRETVRERTETVRYEDAAAKADSDGLTVNTSDYGVSGSRRKRFELSAVLFKCSLIVGVIMLFEFALSLIFRKELGVSLAYPFVIFAIACAQVLIFGVLRVTEVGKGVRKPSTLNYLTASIIVAIILILIICITGILLNVNFSSAGDIMAKIVVPAFVALNIPFFSLFFYIFSK